MYDMNESEERPFARGVSICSRRRALASVEKAREQAVLCCVCQTTHSHVPRREMLAKLTGVPHAGAKRSVTREQPVRAAISIRDDAENM